MCLKKRRFQPESVETVHERSGRRKLWELEPRFHCSLVGTCLELDELKKMGRKMGLSRDRMNDSYRLHVAFVSELSSSTREARYISKCLDRKYRQELQTYARVTSEKELIQEWDQRMKGGDVASLYWVMLTHPKVGEQTLYRLYGEVHMLSHLSGAEIRVDMQKLRIYQSRVRQLEGALKQVSLRWQSQLAEKQQLLSQKLLLEQRLAAREKECSVLQGRMAEAERKLASDSAGREAQGLRNENLVLRDKLDSALREREQWQELSGERERERTGFQKQLSASQKELMELEATLSHLLAPECDECDNTGCSGNLDLCRRRILYVGGRDRQCARFRELVERRNGIFVHHDGGLAQSAGHLASLLATADLVMCPLDCVSHEAVNHIKRECRRTGKSWCPLPAASLAAFNRGLSGALRKLQ